MTTPAFGRMCGPMVCDFPDPPDAFPWLTRWTCPWCGTKYVRARKSQMRWWSTRWAPHGHWRLRWFRSR